MTDVFPESEPPRRTSSPGRVPPHNLQAEESLLGAMLLSRDAIAAAVEVVGTDDFYKPAHSHIFDAVCSLYAAGDPVDPVTVSEELRRAGLIDAIGGPATLVTLQANVPATTSASRYARIVEEHALLRRLIWVAGEMAEKAYSLPDDVTKAVDDAESLVFGVAQRRVTDTTAPIVDLLDQTLDRLEELYERGESITGVPTGFIDLDEILSGLQPSALVVVGARPSMGKALAVDTPVPTPDGWTTMGDLVVGDRVLDDQGQPCAVTYATPVQLGRQCFEIEFDDGSVIVADADHQWPLGAGAKRVMTTRQLVEVGCRDESGRLRWSVPLAYPLDLPDRELPVDPYVLGAWLGADASCHDERDDAHFDAEAKAAAAHWPRPDPAISLIPDEYLRASVKQRLALLQGLADTAASATNGNGTAELFHHDHELVRQVRELVCSLGHKPGKIRPKSVGLGRGIVGVVWRFSWIPLDPVFRLPRKADRIDLHRPFTGAGAGPAGRAITSIHPVESVPVRCITVDSPAHLYLAGESMIPTHNTAFALGVATSAALESQKPVLLFSLEMSQLEVTQRILCAEARVDATRVRNGRLNEADWSKLHHAVGRLAPAQIFIDDNPNITVMDIRAKSRRLKSRVGELGVVIVDYIQLMSGRTSAENRQVEVSEISRNLKILARELETPVIALAQLNRQLETRADKRPMLADLRESGCLTADARLLRADTNEEVTLGELMESGITGVPVWSLDEDLKLVAAPLVRAFSSGEKEVFEIRLASGRNVTASANHPFLTIDGWTPVDELSVGSRVAVPRLVPEPLEPESWPDDELVMLAHLIGDGCVAPRQPIHYTSADPECIEAVQKAATHFGIEPRVERQKNWWHVYLPAPMKLARGRRNPIAAWLDQFGLYGKRSYEKFIPEEIQRLPKEQVALFLRHLWATDGCVGVYGQPRVFYASSSRRLIEDLRRLLLRFEVQTRVGRTRKAGYRPMFNLHVSGVRSQRAFAEQIGVFGARAAGVSKVLQHIGAGAKRPDIETMPPQVSAWVTGALSRANMSRKALRIRAGLSSYQLEKSPLNANRLAAIAEVLEDDELRRLAHADVLWDAVVEILPLGSQPVFDATVVGTHNFVANGICLSNSIEQDADVVLFLYRDEVYNAETPDRGTAEVIIAKHRSGPTGKIRLAWLDHYTKFANMARGV